MSHHRDYSRAAGRNAGTGKFISGTANATYVGMSPELQRDTKLLMATSVKLRAEMNFKFGSMKAGGPEVGQTSHGVYRWFNSFLKMYMQKPHKLSDQVRRFCLHTLNLTELPPLPEYVPPEGLRYLPKKPPVRKVEDDDGDA